MGPFAGLLAALQEIPDPRPPQGPRHGPAPPLLFPGPAVPARAPLRFCGVRPSRAAPPPPRRIRLFIGVHRERLNAVFGAGFRRAPAVNTLRALFHALDPAELEAAFRRHAEQLGGAAAPGQ